MLNSDGTRGKVNILHTDGQSFRDAASQMKQQPDQKAIPEIGGGLLETSYLVKFQVSLTRLAASGVVLRSGHRPAPSGKREQAL